MEEPLLEGLSPSARTALEWAGASALLRGSDRPEVDGFDLLAGVALAHPADSRLDQLLGHFGLPLGAVLAPRYPRAFGPAELVAARERGLREPPSTGQEVAAVLATARSAVATATPGEIHLGALLVALMESGHAATAIADALRLQGADPDRVRASLRAYTSMPQRPPFPEFLARELPWGGPPDVRLPGYLADDPGPARVRPGEAAPADLVGIGPQVDAFAYLAASVHLEPPLAVGLFGDWGSGKSFFMRSLQRRIDALANDPDAAARSAAELPFFRRVAQVEFNAWHYVDGDLWASLVEHLFQNLRVRADEGPAELARRGDALMGLMREASAGAEAAARAIPRLTGELEAARTEAAAAARALEDRRGELPRDVAALALEGVRTEVEDAMRSAGVPGVVADLEEARAGLDEAHDALRQGVLAPFRADRGGRWLALAVVAVVAVPVAVSLILNTFADQIAAAVGGVASVAAVIAMVARTAAVAANRAAGAVRTTRRKLEERVAAAAAAADATRAEVAEAERRLREAEAERDRLERRVEELTRRSSALAGTVLGEFIETSAASDELRTYLGVPAIVRRRLEVLSELIERNNGEVLAGRGDPDQVNRIVLYIDDLDRCPVDHVIRVLQAVHLLLAFPLFVVVVAVDKRWLAGSLAGHYGPLLSSAPDGDRARPDDYVEKIFQVPFQVPPLDAPARRSLLHGLLPLDGGPGAAGEAGDGDEGGELDDVGRLVAEFFDRPGAPAWLRSADLRVSPAELAFIDRIVPLLDDTPRSVKRFANVFLLVKSIAANSGRPFRDAEPTDHQSAILLLALGMGHPALARGVHAAIGARGGGTLAEAVGADGAAILAPVAEWGSRPVADLAGWADLCCRFTFTA